MKKILLLCFLIFGCQLSSRELHERTDNFQYVKDNLTGLYFVSTYANGQFTYVPCTPEVEKLLVK